MFADMQGCIGLLKQAHAYTTEHFMEVIKNQEFLLCSADQVAELLESNDLNVPSEDTIFHVRYGNDVTCYFFYFMLHLISFVGSYSLAKI